MTLISPSILAADFAKLGEEVAAVTAAGADMIHFDVMDGHFVPNISMGPDILKAVKPHTHLPLDVHLMIKPCDPFLEAFAKAGADIISIHPESGPHLHKSLQTIKALGCKAGIVFNPATSLDVLDHVIDMVDLILIMTVNPGFGGQAFIDLSDKIAEARQRITQTGRNIMLEIDGGVTKDTAVTCRKAGADVLVAGTAIFKTGDYKRAVSDIRGAA